MPPIVKNWYLCTSLVGIAIAIADWRITDKVCDNLQPGEKALVETPLSKLLTVANVAIIAASCPNGGKVYRECTLLPNGKCSVKSVVVCNPAPSKKV